MKNNRMRTRLFQWMFVLAIMAGSVGNLWAASKLTTSTCPTLGAGTVDAPYQISTVAHLGWLSDNVSSTTWNASTVYYRVTKNINAASTASWNDGDTGKKTKEGFKPIGTRDYPFLARFEGGKRSISGLTINRATTDCVGLFGYIGSDARITSLTLLGGAVKGDQYVGSLVGYAAGGDILNCRTTSKVIGRKDVGGLGGYLTKVDVANCSALGQVQASEADGGGLIGYLDSSTISSCQAAGKVTGNESIGGLVGYASNNCLVEQSYATGAATAYYQYAGGLVGYTNTAEITNCQAFGKVTAYYYVGGLLGYAYSGTINNCFAKGAVVATDIAGGLVGYAEICNVQNNCYATGKVLAAWDGGGLLGSASNCVVKDCYANNAVSGTENFLGGLIGFVQYSDVSGCWAFGNVTGGAYVGGLVGESDYSNIKVCNVTGKVSGDAYVGGLVGYAGFYTTLSYNSVPTLFGTISESAASGKVIGDAYVGGLVGYCKYQDISGCTANGAVTGIDYVGGLAGYCEGTYASSVQHGSISESSAAGKVTGTDVYTGGLVGYALRFSIETSFATGMVKGNNIVGGLVGMARGYSAASVQHGSVTDCYARGLVLGNDNVGGLIGYARGESGYGGTFLIDDCYATGKIVSPGDLVGGLVAWQDEGLVTCTDSWWDTLTSGVDTSALGGGRITEEMTDPNVLTIWGWNTSVWGQNASINNGYPYLK